MSPLQRIGLLPLCADTPADPARLGELAGQARIRTFDPVAHFGPLRHPDGVLGLVRALDVVVCLSPVTRRGYQGPRTVLEGTLRGYVPVVGPTRAIPEVLDTCTDLASSRLGEITDYALARFSEWAVESEMHTLWSGLATTAPQRTR